MSSIGDENYSKNENDAAQNNTVVANRFFYSTWFAKIQQLKLIFF